MRRHLASLPPASNVCQLGKRPPRKSKRHGRKIVGMERRRRQCHSGLVCKCDLPFLLSSRPHPSFPHSSYCRFVLLLGASLGASALSPEITAISFTRGLYHLPEIYSDRRSSEVYIRPHPAPNVSRLSAARLVHVQGVGLLGAARGNSARDKGTPSGVPLVANWEAA
ncbi:hypothetical protein EDB92DRAFT_850497 [Lactarius akahatsu]|uniref:Uncharacterized protein n=1 Tax=Lactarius akahatsu TaxID=416441 RepID=A0AAD4LFG0_9AGAM|nr:hypothetical protein EDB92DRAFT_850497 [Lactarius akahatsu]